MQSSILLILSAFLVFLGGYFIGRSSRPVRDLSDDRLARAVEEANEIEREKVKHMYKSQPIKA